MANPSSLTPADTKSGVRMVDVTSKPDSIRTAVAAGRVVLGDEAFEQVRDEKVRKGDVLTTAQIAGIQGSKQTSKLIPLCHDVTIDGVEVDFTLDEDEKAVEIRAFTKSVGATGVEMEALTAVSLAALTIYDMCKSINRGIRIEDIHLLAKTGGQSGNWKSEERRSTSKEKRSSNAETGAPTVN